MSLGNLLSSLAPVAAGFMTGGSSLAFAPLLAGAATGAGIAALRDEDPLMGAITGGISGYGGGSLGQGVRDFGMKQAGGQAALDASKGFSAGPVMTDAAGKTIAPQVLPSQAVTSPLRTGITAALDKPTDFLRSMGGGDALKGGVKTAAAVTPGIAGAFVPDMNTTTAEENQMAKYDPNRRLNLNMNTGLRLLNEGGYLDRPPTPEEVEAFRKFEQERQLRESMGLPDIMSPERMEAFRKFEQDRQLEESMRNYQEGGYLETGMGDGMSDDIPSSIDGAQPAALSENEFVIPADVVSGLGNGSSDAGAEQLYAMLDRVRKARTGTKEMGKEITAERLMPA
tara:strand:- start:16 stop:1035 length:1020 start_codon:yes stop_codon:yes gene_type:complete